MLYDPRGVAVDSGGNVYVTGNDADCRGQSGFPTYSDYPCGNAFKLTFYGWVLYDRDAEAISHLLSERSLMESMGVLARKRVQRDFAMEQMAQKNEDFYYELLEAPSER